MPLFLASGYTKGVEMAETNGAYSPDRLDRIERIVEALATVQMDMANTQASMQQDIKNLYVSQVVMGETLTKVAEAQKELAEAQKELAEAQKELAEAQTSADARMDALIVTVDEIIRGRKRQG